LVLVRTFCNSNYLNQTQQCLTPAPNFNCIEPACCRCLSQAVRRWLLTAEFLLLSPVNFFEVHSGRIGGLPSKTSWIRSLVGKCGNFLWIKRH
jgi:hypothetical protein